MANFVGYIVHEDPTMPGGERFELLDLRGFSVNTLQDVWRFLNTEGRTRPDLAGRRIDFVDLDEKPLDG